MSLPPYKEYKYVSCPGIEPKPTVTSKHASLDGTEALKAVLRISPSETEQEGLINIQ